MTFHHCVQCVQILIIQFVAHEVESSAAAATSTLRALAACVTVGAVTLAASLYVEFQQAMLQELLLLFPL